MNDSDVISSTIANAAMLEAYRAETV